MVYFLVRWEQKLPHRGETVVLITSVVIFKLSPVWNRCGGRGRFVCIISNIEMKRGNVYYKSSAVDKLLRVALEALRNASSVPPTHNSRHSVKAKIIL
jgi:hypothetical protein